MAIDLLPFQAEDVLKLKSKRARLIGNDPGTGKTYEGIALDQANRNGDGNSKVDHSQYKNKKTLIVAPKNVLAVWDDHLMELTEDDIYLYTYHTRHQFLKSLLDPRCGGYFIMNYESVRISSMKDIFKVNFFHIIADECHRIKNRKSFHTRALKRLRTVYKTAMSGTPADNKPTDLWSILNWLWPNYYTSFWRFVKAYTIQEDTEEGYSKIIGLHEENIKELHAEMEPWFVRRRKQDVLKDLPDKYYSRLWVDLDPKQRRAYDEMKKTMIAWCENHVEEIEREDPLIAQAVVAQLVRLQQFTAGYMVPVLDENGKQLIVRKHKGHPRGECPFDGIPVGELTEMHFGILDEEEIKRIKCRDVPQWEMIDPSAKLDAVMELLEDRGNDQIIIFSQFKSVINLLEKRLANAGITYGVLTGDVKQEDRDRYIREFQDGQLRVFAGTIKAGGVGITLTAASTVVFIDRWWNPAINIQAEDRAHRIGQTEAVEIIDIMARSTVDLGRHAQIATKWKWLQMLMGDEVNYDQVVNELQLSPKALLEMEVGE